MKPTIKSQAVEQMLTKLTGLDRRETIEANFCLPAPIGCGLGVNAFRDELSKREYAISGLCQVCQDKVFG